MNNIPTVFAVKETIRGTDLLTFNCPECGKKHTHGYREGHRVAHCDNWENGYYLKERKDDL